MADRLRLDLLGGLRIRRGAETVGGFVSGKATALLCYLAVTGRQHFRSSLAGMLWSEMPEPSARMNLRHVLANLRQVVGPHLLITRDSVALETTSVVVDVEQFEAALRDTGSHDAARLREAVAHYGGDFLEGFSLRDAPVWDEWMVLQRERLRQLAMQALHSLIVHHHERAEYAAALDYATRMLQLDPWREEAHRQVMLLLAEGGRPGAALVQYETCRRVLRDELDVEPDHETTELAERIKAGAIVPRLPVSPNHNLPIAPTTLLGRSDDLTALIGMLLQPSCRLLTLLGPGGVGKTRLALELAAQQAATFADGARLVELAAIRQPELLATAIAQALGIREADRQPLIERVTTQLRDKHLLLVLDNFEQLLRAAPIAGLLLAGCPRLKILVTSRAALRIRGEHEYHVAPLAVPDVTAAYGDQEWSPGTLSGYAAVDLFVRHASTVWPGFALSDDNAGAVAQICSRLDGLPLALELAAARIKLLSPHGIRARLGNRLALLTGGANDLPTRQQTLRNTIEWSYDLLEPDEQVLFTRLAVFVGSFSVDDAQAICALDNRDASWALDAIGVLLDRSLLRAVTNEAGEQRLDMLETIHEYAAEQLEASGEGETVRRRHAAHFLALAELAEPELQGAEQRSWLDRLELEHANLRAALEWMLGSGETEMAQRLAGALGEFWWPRGYISEGRRWLERAVEQSGNSAPAVRAKALYRAGELAFAYCDYGQSVVLLNQSLTLYQALDDPAGIGRVLRGLANSLIVQGDEQQATELRHQALHYFRQIDDRWGIAWMLYHLALRERDAERKLALFEESLALSRAGGFMRTSFAVLNDMAHVALHNGEHARAEPLYLECLQLCEELNDRWLRALPLTGLGLVARDAGDYRRAAALFEESLAANQQAQNQGGSADLSSHLGDLARWQNDIAGAAERYERSLGLYRAANDVRGMTSVYLKQGQLALQRDDVEPAEQLFLSSLGLLPIERPDHAIHNHLFALGGIAIAEDQRGRSENAACLFGALEQLGLGNEPSGFIVARADRTALHRAFHAAKQRLEPRFAAAWARGRGMSLAEAIAYARAAAS